MSESARRQIVIVGGVACGLKAAARARRRDPEAQITVIEQGREISYAGCGLPYVVGGTVGEIEKLWSTTYGVARTPDFFKATKDVDVRRRTRAEAIDRANRQLRTRDLETGKTELLPYDYLVLATGAEAVRPAVEGAELERVFTLHTPEDARRLAALIEEEEPEHATIIGGGRIGLELSEAFFAQAIDTTLIEIADCVLSSVLDADMAAQLENALRAQQVEVYTAEQVQRIEADEAGRAARVVTDRREIETDLIVIAAGVRPRVELAREAGLEIGKTGAIAVNEFMETDDPAILAGGDCVEVRDLVSGETIYAPQGSTANRQGRVIGTNVTGGHEVFPGVVRTSILRTLGQNVATTGLTEAEARRLGYDVVSGLVPGADSTHFYPGAKPLMLKLVADAKSGKVLGAQVLGPGEVAKRIDTVATALTFGATVDQLADLDLAYAPPFSNAMDVIAHAANLIRNKRDGAAHPVSAAELRAELAGENPPLVLDVREEHEVQARPAGGIATQWLPYSELFVRLGDVARDADVVVLCQVGARSYDAHLTLRGAGFSNARFLEGGLRAWAGGA